MSIEHVHLVIEVLTVKMNVPVHAGPVKAAFTMEHVLESVLLDIEMLAADAVKDVTKAPMVWTVKDTVENVQAYHLCARLGMKGAQTGVPSVR